MATVRQKLLFIPKHEVGLLFFGTRATQNDLQADGYDNVWVAPPVQAGAMTGGAASSSADPGGAAAVRAPSPIEPPSLPMVRLLTDPPVGGEESDAVNGLIVAIDLLIKRTREFKFRRTVRILTDNSSVSPGDQDIHECFRQLRSIGGHLVVTLIAPNAAGVAGGGDGLWAVFAAQHPDVVSLEPSTTLAHATSLCVKPVEQRAKVRLSLVVAQDFQIPVGVFTKTTVARFPTLKRRSRLAANVPEEHRKTDAVLVERTYHVADDPDGEEVKLEDRVKAYKYGQSIVPMSEFDEAALMYRCERTLTTLGFAPAVSIPPESSTHTIETVAADKGDRWAYCAFESLVAAMLAEGVVLVARYCFRNNASPRMVALVPHLTEVPTEASSFTMQYLPFAEDWRDWPFASFVPPSDEHRNAVAALVEAADLAPICDGASASSATCGAAGSSTGEVLRPEDTYNPSLQRFYSFVVQRALNPAAKMSPVACTDATVGIVPPEHVVRRMEEAKVAERLKAVFGLERVEKPSKKTKRFWREAIAEKRKEAALGEVDIKKIKVDVAKKDEEKKEEQDDHVKAEAHGLVGGAGGVFAVAESMMAQPVLPPPQVHVGSVHPERDFERWLAYRGGGHDTVGPAVQQMIALIERFADEGDDFLGRAFSCLAVLRRGCVREGEVVAFNDFLRRFNVSSLTLPRRQQLWRRARETHLGLITDLEVPTSTVSPEEARAFLAGEESCSARPLSSSGAGAAHLTDKDLEDMIE
eukprot:TRINITY_DN54939_c0_g1_i1.p1 TRINITY_DN54939_c0_g1~~TRINITY_DN54939_c0_g1_i1.p1  ORF type:complete len:819 (+),score=165.88 TRINITY_DN54939_c0_g1_i1:199-2457(+)